MPRRYLVFENLSPYHIVNRGVDKRVIFQEESDYYRFIFQIYAANFGSPGPNLQKKKIIEAAKSLLTGEGKGTISSELLSREHPPLVYILNFCLMPNHIHFNLAQRVEGGISKFMQKLSCGFARYFNAKYERTGTLFEGRFKAVSIKGEYQLDAVTRYININPLDIFQPGWREEGLRDWEGALQFLKEYQWSSYPDFIGIRQSRLLPPKGILKMFYGGEFDSHEENPYRKFIEDYLEQNLRDIYVFLEETAFDK